MTESDRPAGHHQGLRLSILRITVFVLALSAQSVLATTEEDTPDITWSPCGRYGAFLRDSTNIATFFAMESSDLLSQQIWLIERESDEEWLLVEDGVPQSSSGALDIENLIQLIDERSLTFSPDGDRLYFLAQAWATSAALHVVDIESRTRSFLLPANRLVAVIPSGDYADHLVVQQHRYFLGGGSYDWYWLFTPEGREVGPVASSHNDLAMFLNAHAGPKDPDTPHKPQKEPPYED